MYIKKMILLRVMKISLSYVRGGVTYMLKELSQNRCFLEVPYGTLEFQRCSRAKNSGHCQTKKKSIFFWEDFQTWTKSPSFHDFWNIWWGSRGPVSGPFKASILYCDWMIVHLGWWFYYCMSQSRNNSWRKFIMAWGFN